MGLNKSRTIVNIIALLLSCLVVICFVMYLIPRIKKEVNVYQNVYTADCYVLKSNSSAVFYNHIGSSFNKLIIYLYDDCLESLEVAIEDCSDGKLVIDEVFHSENVHKDECERYYIELFNSVQCPAADYQITLNNRGDSALGVKVSSDNDNNLGLVAIKDTNDGELILYIVAAMAIIYLVTMFGFSMNGELTIQKFFVISAISLSVIYIVIFPIWSTTDFTSHYSAANRFSNLLLGRHDNQWCSNDAYFDYLVDIDINGAYPGMRGYTYFLENFRFMGGFNGTVVECFRDDKMICYSIFGYLPSSLGLLLATILDFAPATGLIFARLFPISVYVAGCSRAIKVTPIGKHVFAATALLPEVVLLSGSFSYDSIVVVATLNFLACTFAASNSANGGTNKYAREAIFWSFLIGAVKGGGYLILLPVAFMMWTYSAKEGITRRRRIAPIVITITGLISVFFFNVVMNSGAEMFQFGGEIGKMSASYALYHPVRFLDMLINSYFRYSTRYIIGLLGSELAWSELVLPGFLVIIMFIPLCLLAMLEIDAYRINRKSKVLFGISIILVLVFMPLMLLSYTDIGSATIEGVQGRYFLPILPLVLLLITNYDYSSKIKMNEGSIALVKQIAIWTHIILSVVAVMWILKVYLTRSAI